MLPYAGRNLLDWPEVSAGSTSRYLGLLATAMSRWQDAERYFVAAIEMDRRTGGRPWLAHGQRDYAGMLLARAVPGDRALITSARATYAQLGMDTHAASATNQLESAFGQAAVR